MNIKEYYVPSTYLEILSYFMLKNDFVCGVYSERKLIAFSCVSYSSKKKYYTIEDTAVLEEYRGSGYQKQMWKYIIDHTPNSTSIYCTIHPHNHISLSNALSSGFRAIDCKIKYHSVRYILKYSR